MRDLAFTAIFAALAAMAFRRPEIGILTWTWVSMMNPHRLAYGFAHNMPVAMIIALVTFVGMLLDKRPRKMPWYPPTVLLVMFDLWMVVTHFSGFHPELVHNQAIDILKIQVMVFVTMFVLSTKRDIVWFVVVVAFSVGFYGIKGGLFVIATGGSYKVWGPPTSFLEGNNEIALALVITIPLLYFFHVITEGKWLRRGLVAAMILCAIAALGSQSRGALLAMVAMVSVLWLRSRRKTIFLMAMLPIALVVVSLMSVAWKERMDTLRTYDQDMSAMQRIDVWRMTINLALANPITGGGYGIYTHDLNSLYNPDPIGGLRNAHSIYFSVLGEHGFVGLFLFLSIWFSVWRTCAKIRDGTRNQTDLNWVFWLASMLQVSMIGYLVGGAFLYLPYVDFPYNLLIVAVLLRKYLDASGEERRAIEIGARNNMTLTHERSRS